MIRSAGPVAVSAACAGLLFGALLMVARGSRESGRGRILSRIAGSRSRVSGAPPVVAPDVRAADHLDGVAGGRRVRWRLLAAACAALAAPLGFGLAGPAGSVVLAGGAAAMPLWMGGREHRRRLALLDIQTVDLLESLATGLQSGLSVRQAFEHAAPDLERPMADLVQRALDEHRIGIPFDETVRDLAGRIGTDEAKLLALVLRLHGRGGGNVAEALGEVLETVRDRLAVRRELRALTAQGKLSGLILAAVPIGFFLFLAATSRQELGPVYRSAPGMLMVGTGLALEGLALLWIRRILRVQV